MALQVGLELEGEGVGRAAVGAELAGGAEVGLKGEVMERVAA